MWGCSSGPRRAALASRANARVRHTAADSVPGMLLLTIFFSMAADAIAMPKGAPRRGRTPLQACSEMCKD